MSDAMVLREVGPDFDRAWLPTWAKGMPILKIGDKNPPYTYADWLEWPIVETGTMELMDGLIVALAAPGAFHNGIDAEMARRIGNYLQGKQGRVYSNKLAVRLFPNSRKKEDNFTVEPDVCVILDTSKINKEGCQGAPDFITEILSPSNSKTDTLVKFNNYQKAGVREYWIVNPKDRTIQVNLLENGRYVVSMYGEEKVPVTTLPGLEIDFAEVFDYAWVE
jgi:Uma2 family endonuclease